MADLGDLLHAWEAAIREVGGAAGSVAAGSAELAGQLGAPLRRQADVLEKVLQRQLDFERELVGRLLTPARTVLDVAEQTTSALRAQATAFRVAAASFGQVADLLEQEAELLQHASSSIRAPVAALRSAGAALRDDRRQQDQEDG
jgi:hypothetical protein